MAIFLPALSSKNLRLTPGERRFGTCLMRKLEDDYHVWINVPVGPKQFRPDYVVLHPGRGILVLEVKDWKLPTIRQVDRFSAQLLTDRGLKTVANPLEQARAYAISIKELLERDPLLVQQEPGRYHGHLVITQGTNPGRSKADEAAKTVGGTAIFPIFALGENVYPAKLPPITPQTYREHERAVHRLEAAQKEPEKVRLTPARREKSDRPLIRAGMILQLA